jgi:hypothetical protein
MARGGAQMLIEAMKTMQTGTVATPSPMKTKR